MIKKLSFISVIIFCFCAVSVSAQEAADRSSGRNNNLDQRVTDRIQKLKTVLSANQIRDLKTRCNAAQNKLKSIKKVAAVYSSAQNERVDRILDKAGRLSAKLKDQGIDATPIDQNIEEINQLKTQIDSAYKNYLLAVDDSSTINCKVGPEGFRSSVDDAKNQFSELADLRKSLRDLIKIELRETLIDLKDSL